MPYREPAAPATKIRVLETGRFRLARVRLSIVAILGITISGAVLHLIAHARLDCDRAKDACDLRVTGHRARRFRVSELERAEVIQTWLTSTRGGDSAKAYLPRLVLESHNIELFEIDHDVADDFLEQADQFVTDENVAELSFTMKPSVGGPIVQIIFLCPLLVIFLVSAMRGGGGTVRITVEGNTLKVQRRWRFFGWKVKEFAIDEIRGVDVERKGRRAQLRLLMKSGHESCVTDRLLATDPFDAPERVAQELRIAMQCVVMPDEPAPAAEPPRTISVSGGMLAGLVGLGFGFALFHASDLLVNSLVSDGNPDHLLFFGCLGLGAIVGAIWGGRR